MKGFRLSYARFDGFFRVFWFKVGYGFLLTSAKWLKKEGLKKKSEKKIAILLKKIFLYQKK